MQRIWRPKCSFVLILAWHLLCGSLIAQAPSSLDTNSSKPETTPSTLQTAVPESTPELNVEKPASAAITLPAGTRVLLMLKSPLHTTSAVAGSGVYLETVAPVVQGNHVVIPARTQVLGEVDAERRPGRVKGRAQFRLHFTSLVFANNYVTPIDGALQSLPGNRKVRTQDAQGTIEPVDQIDKDVATLAGAAATGFLVGSVRGGRIKATEHSAIGAGIGAGLALGKVLFTRGDEIRLDSGTLLEMVLRQPISIELEHVPPNSESSSQSRYALPDVNHAPDSWENHGRGFPASQSARPRVPLLPWPLRLFDLMR